VLVGRGDADDLRRREEAGTADRGGAGEDLGGLGASAWRPARLGCGAKRDEAVVLSRMTRGGRDRRLI